MKTAIILSALAACANAAYYIIDTVPELNGAFTYWATLRYDADHYTARQLECVDKMGVTINRGDIGSDFKICPDSNIRMGLYFPHGYNGTISEAYDYHNKVFYPCVRINNEVTKSYACGGVFMQDFLPK
ncbi:hypothetical protein BGZ91_003379 [Linnemannia elongata]|nr:hypothetical protein BGZ91_003379 [Linnemannia elongata]KAG0056615.1 hypothetical protein BGZ90_005497 [Linnemannia elongata]